ncbi:MAG: DUF370 domain-containing protein [Clostridiales bacterium]|nr:DUF370 domain-containing protein [Clostridiales bacterium]
MYLHLGQDEVVPSKTVVGIFDLDITSQSGITRKYLKNAQQSGAVVNVSEELPKSFVVCEEGGNSKIYLSQLSSSTLLKRVEIGSDG